MARPAVPTATQLLARPSQYVLATQHGAITRSKITRTSAQLGSDRTVDARGWIGELNGGQPASTGGTDHAPTALVLSDENAGSAKPLRLALVGSTTATPPAKVGTIRGQTTPADDRYLWPVGESWGHLKGFDGWTGPNFDAHGLRISYNSAVTASGDWQDTSIGAVISGMRFKDTMDAIFIGTAPTSYLLEHSYFTGVRDDVIEADHSNTPGYLYKCLVDGAFTMYSTRKPNTNRTACTTTYDSCIICLRRNRWRPPRGESACRYAAYGDWSGDLGSHGQIDKRNANSPKVHFRDCLIYLESPPSGPSGCRGSSGAWATMGFGNSTRATAENSTLLWARCPDHPDFPVSYTSDTFIPAGMKVLTYQGNEAVLTSAIQRWHDEHPQFGLASAAGGTGQSAGMLAH